MQGHSWSHSELYRLVWSLYLRPCLRKTKLNWKWRLNDHPPEEKQTGEARFQAGQLCAPSGLTDKQLEEGAVFHTSGEVRGLFQVFSAPRISNLF